MRLDQPTPASLVGRWVDTPPVVFKTRGDAYRGKIVSIDTARAKHVVVRFQDQPATKYFFPVTDVVKWLVDPSDHHPDDEEHLRTGLNVEDGNNDAISDDDDDEDDSGGDEDDEEPLYGATARAPQRKARKEKNAEQKETERKVAEAQQQVQNSWVESSEVTKDVPAFEPGNCKPGLRQETLDNKPPTASEGIFYMFLNLLPVLTFWQDLSTIARRTLISSALVRM
jgi:hypothetical protein